MAEIIRPSDLRDNNAEIMRRVAGGESFTITVYCRPDANLVPHQRQITSRLVRPPNSKPGSPSWHPSTGTSGTATFGKKVTVSKEMA